MRCRSDDGAGGLSPAIQMFCNAAMAARKEEL